MSGQPLQRKVMVRNPNGFHMRPMAAFVEKARALDCVVMVANGPVRVNGLLLIELMGLNAPTGTELLLEVEGPQAEKAIDELAAILAAVEPPPD
jgi:phosphotransferase system HPr (HPr) family protein